MLETYSKQSYQYLFDALLDDLILRGKPYLKFMEASDHEPATYELDWAHCEPRVSQQDIDLLIGALIDEEKEWPNYIWESEDLDSMQAFTARAFRGKIGAPQLGHVMIKAARKHYGAKIQESLIPAIEQRLLSEERGE